MNVLSVLHHTPTPVLGSIAALRYRGDGLYGSSRAHTRFIILGHQRTGSTLVASSLRRHPQIWCYSEVFNPKSIQFYTPGLSNDSILLKVYRERDPVAFLERFVFRGYRSHIRAIGFKLFPAHIRPPHMAGLVDALAADRDVRLIRIRRSNHLRVLLSLQLARRTAHWSSKGDGHPADARVVIEPDALLAFSAQRQAEEAMLRNRFAGSPFHEVEYESLAADLPRVLNDLQDFLGLEHAPLEPVLQKQTTGSLPDRIVNYDVLRARFADTEYAAWLDG